MVVVACVEMLMVPCQGELGVVPEGAGDVRLWGLTTSGLGQQAPKGRLLSDHSRPHRDAFAGQQYRHLERKFPYLSCRQVLPCHRSNALVAMLAQLWGLVQLAQLGVLSLVGATKGYSLALAKVSRVSLYSQRNEERSHEEKGKERFPAGLSWKQWHFLRPLASHSKQSLTAWVILIPCLILAARCPCCEILAVDPWSRGSGQEMCCCCLRFQRYDFT